MEKIIEKKTTLKFKKGLEVTEVGYFCLDSEVEINLEDELRNVFNVGDIIKVSFQKVENVEE